MTIPAVTDILASVAPQRNVEPLTPASDARQLFEQLLNDETATTSPSELLTAQSALGQVTLGAELTAKVAGAFSQGVNKLVNMQ
ncbi:type III secretion system inner rod subunit SctI [Chromobacterium violaceum]|uniref:type III secretion system inner rod subunit SctI n=1 Tax=Chromobacterium violaceum TaxID=536 RepID=UPI001BEA55EE|nr:type III secretion system inner rod subunit SctI [Chromobacterium violaceum]MBT2869680.1 type III secretion system inner rod subunit SctI [Chromobacterium violaceum]